MNPSPPVTVSTPPAQTDPEEHEGQVGRLDLARILLVGLAAVATWFKLWRPFPQFDALALIATAVGAWPIAREAFSALLARRMTMELSMTLAFAAALAVGENFTALVLVLFVLIAEVLEHLTVGRGRHAIKELLEYLPRTTFVRREDATCEIPTEEVRCGDIVVIKPGSALSVDGTVVKGTSFVDQATVTGESLPVEKIAGSSVYAGTLNQAGALEVLTTRVGRDTAFGRIIESVENSEQARAPIQKTADRLSGLLVYFAIGCAILTFLISRNVRSTISVVIVAGACGIAAGTPLAILGAIGRAARQRVIIKGGLHLEALWTIDTVVLDKTGTLTFGAPEVTDILPRDGVTAQHLLESAAIAERPSEHPLGKAVLKKASALSIPVTEPDRFEYTPGEGISCSYHEEIILVGNRSFLNGRGIAIGESPASGSELFVSRAGSFLGSLRVADVLRPGSSEAVRAFKTMGLRTILLTGDSEDAANVIGTRLGVDETAARLLPDDKLKRIDALIREGRRVAMVGDGINDVPALTRATVGIAMGSGTDVAREAAHIVLIGNDLERLVDVFRIARRCHRIIQTNFYGTLIVDGVGVALSAFGLLNPLVAAFIHVSSELAFILNSARLLPGRSTVGRERIDSAPTP